VPEIVNGTEYVTAEHLMGEGSCAVRPAHEGPALLASTKREIGAGRRTGRALAVTT
jgi:hypothetical protein